MQSFFTLIYIVANRFSDEKIAVAVLANINGIPYFGLANKKLNFALSTLSPALRSAIKKGFKYMDLDVNKINRGQEALSLFDPPYSKKLLKELTHKKRGVVTYSDVYEITQSNKSTQLNFESLFKKFLGEDFEANSKPTKSNTFKTRFANYITHKRFSGFDVNYKLAAGEYPFIYRDMRVDLCRKSNYYTVFYTVDFSRSIQAIQTSISRFRLIVQSLQQVSTNEGLGSGRYYLVYESTTSRSKLALINTIRGEKNLGYSIIRMTEMKDKI